MEFQHYTEGQLWRVVQIKGKGLGAIAKTDISKGQNLTVEKNNNDECMLAYNFERVRLVLKIRDRPLLSIFFVC